MPYFTKKPVTVKALQFDGSVSCYNKIIEAFPDLVGVVTYCRAEGHRGDLLIKRFEVCADSGRAEVAKNDWVIKGIEGEYYPCKPDIFQQTYEPADTKEEPAFDPAACVLDYDISKAMWYLNTQDEQEVNPVSLPEATAYYKKGVSIHSFSMRLLKSGVIPSDHDIRWL